MERVVRARLLQSCLPPLGILCLFAASPAKTEVIHNPVAIFAALDKVTGRISHLGSP
jgi:hypothetical protein